MLKEIENTFTHFFFGKKGCKWKYFIIIYVAVTAYKFEKSSIRCVLFHYIVVLRQVMHC